MTLNGTLPSLTAATGLERGTGITGKHPQSLYRIGGSRCETLDTLVWVVVAPAAQAELVCPAELVIDS
jgi:hypothetical protein